MRMFSSEKKETPPFKRVNRDTTSFEFNFDSKEKSCIKKAVSFNGFEENKQSHEPLRILLLLTFALPRLKSYDRNYLLR